MNGDVTMEKWRMPRLSEARLKKGLFMTTTDAPTTPCRWPINRILLAVLFFGFLTLMADIRIEHADRFHKFWQAWIPIYYGGTMAVACLVGTIAWWTPVVRRIVFWLFGLGFVVGSYGLYLHNHGNFGQLATTMIDAWIGKIKHQDVPPQLAPAAFCGLALIGMLVCARRTQAR